MENYGTSSKIDENRQRIHRNWTDCLFDIGIDLHFDMASCILSPYITGIKGSAITKMTGGALASPGHPQGVGPIMAPHIRMMMMTIIIISIIIKMMISIIS